MALLNKLFTKIKLEYGNRGTRKRDRSHQITPEQVRLLLFKECEWRGRKLLFDSSTIEKTPAGKNDKPDRQTDVVPCIVEVSDGYSYVYKGPAADASVLGEMIFGAVAINHRGVSFKIHIIDDPKRLMCTKVFCVPVTRRVSRVERKTSELSSSDVRYMTSTPLNVPTVREEGVTLSPSDRGDSGFCGDQSPHSSVGSTYDYFSMFDIWDENTKEDYWFHSPPGRKLSTSSNGSWQRRTFQNFATRFDLGQNPSSSHLLHVPAPSGVSCCDSQVYSNSSTSGTNDSLTSCGVSPPQRRSKLGLAMLITIGESEMDEVRRCLEHSTQLQGMVCRLRLATLAAGAGNYFVSTLHRAASDAARWLSELLYGPRLQPAWLSLVTAAPRAANKMADSLLADLCTVLSVGDTKQTNFFISTLLTHVLTYHLGWVTTVSPYDTLDPQQALSEAKRSYNVLWAQLNDLCGAIGFPPRAARTIITGSTNKQFINKLLTVLTYFLRSGDVIRTDYKYQESVLKETKVISVNSAPSLKRTRTVNKLEVPVLNVECSYSADSVASDVVRRSATLASFGKLSNLQDLSAQECSDAKDSCSGEVSSTLRRNPTTLTPFTVLPDLSSSEESDPEQKVLFVLGDDDKLVGLKNKSNGGRAVKKSSRVHPEPEPELAEARKTDEPKTEYSKASSESREGSPSKCCWQTLQHSKPIKHSGFKFEFDKYPQIVTNYMKSKNLEILDRHYIGKPGNLKLDNFQFDPTVVPPIQEERCEICDKCQQLEALLQTPTNASEMDDELNDLPRQAEPQRAKETIVDEASLNHREISPKTFVRQRKQNTIVVNAMKRLQSPPRASREEVKVRVKEKDAAVAVKTVIELAMPAVSPPAPRPHPAGFHTSLLGGVSDHYVPDLILQGTTSSPCTWERELRRDLDVTAHLHKGLDAPLQAVAILGDTNTWEVQVVSRGGAAGGAGGMSARVGAMLDALPAMRRARVPAHQCLSFLEGKLRELCVLSKTLADLLLSSELLDMATLTASLQVDASDVPLLLAVATTHSPLVATRYGLGYCKL